MNANVEQRHRDALEALGGITFGLHQYVMVPHALQALANAEQRGREDEREECAKVCEEQLPPRTYEHDPIGTDAYNHAADECAAAIRARGQRKEAE